MGQERELKYSSPEGRVPELHELEAALAPLELQVSPPHLREQTDTYFDDPELSLERAKLALRVRSRSGSRVAAVKGRGSVVSGLFEREEIEAPLGPGPTAAAGEAERRPRWPAVVAQRLEGVIDPARLAPRLVIGTTRVAFALSRHGDAVAELAFDEVSCRPPAGGTDALIDEVLFSEVEIESAGETSNDELRRIGAALGELLPLVPGDVSKLERATVLLAPFL